MMKYKKPMCNHIAINESNFGYTTGLLRGEIPYEAEINESDGDINLLVVLPFLEELLVESKENLPIAASSEILPYSKQELKRFNGVLIDGMVEGDITYTSETLEKYVELLIEEDLVTFQTCMLNGAIFDQYDFDGKHTVAINITLRDENTLWVSTDIEIEPFAEIISGKATRKRPSKKEFFRMVELYLKVYPFRAYKNEDLKFLLEDSLIIELLEREYSKINDIVSKKNLDEIYKQVIFIIECMCTYEDVGD